VSDDTQAAGETPSQPAIAREYAHVEIMGHREHRGEIAEVQRFGVTLLQVHDVDTGSIHYYGGHSIFSLTLVSKAAIDAHVAERERIARVRAEQEAKWAAGRAARDMARALEAPAPSRSREVSAILVANGEVPACADFKNEEGALDVGDVIKLTEIFWKDLDRVHDVLNLLRSPPEDIIVPSIAEMARWSHERLRETAEWAVARVWSLTAFPNVYVPTRPDFIEEIPS
jgi:hypothetical protein